MLKIFKKLVVISLVFVLLVSLGTTGVAFGKKIEIALITKNLINPFWITMKDGAMMAADDLGIKLTYYAPIKPDNVLEQISIMESLIERKIDGIVVVPADSKGIIPGIEKANKAGIPVATSNTRAFGGKIVGHVGVGNYDAAYTVAKYMLDKKLQGKGKIIILEGTPGSSTGMERKRGFDDAVKEFPGITVLTSQTALYVRKEGMRVMENLLSRFPKIDLVLAANDEMALGAIEAIKAAGRMDEILVSGFDANNDAVKAVAKKELVATVDQGPIEQAYWAVVDVYAALKDHARIPPYIATPAVLVDGSNVEEYLKERGLKVEK
ncbi:MAG: sugar ABC transporter substrate-binding protein [Candidatus Hydrothermarchaeota archaeon]